MDYFYCTLIVTLLALQILTLKIPVAHSESIKVDSLTYSQVICRHGNRNPLNKYGKYEELYESIWPEGVGELSELGKYEAYQIGKFLRDRYAQFLAEDYKSNEIFVLSSGTERTVQTAGNCLQGLYQKFNDAASWAKDASTGYYIRPYEAVPIRTVPSELDNLLSLSADCPKREQYLEDIRNSSFDQEYFRNDKTLEYVLQNTGQTMWLNPNATYRDVHFEFYNALEIITSLAEQNKTLEDWMIPLLSNEKYLSYKYHLIEKEHASNLSAHRLHIGSLIKLMLENINKHLAGTREKILDVFIGHDKNLLSLGWTLAINSTFDNIMPPPGSCLLVELHRNIDKEEPILEFWYRKGSEKVKRAISAHCGDPCTLKGLLKMTEQVLNVDYQKECQLD